MKKFLAFFKIYGVKIIFYLNTDHFGNASTHSFIIFYNNNYNLYFGVLNIWSGWVVEMGHGPPGSVEGKRMI